MAQRDVSTDGGSSLRGTLCGPFLSGCSRRILTHSTANAAPCFSATNMFAEGSHSRSAHKLLFRVVLKGEVEVVGKVVALQKGWENARGLARF
jgi:hypothetical protein